MLIQSLNSGDLDLALTLGGSESKTARVLSELPLHWIASPRFKERAEPAAAAGIVQPTVWMSDKRAGLACRRPGVPGGRR